MNADQYGRYLDQRRVIRVQAVLLALSLVVIGLAGWQVKQYERIIEAQESALDAADQRIDYLEYQITDLQEQMDAESIERAISRGNSRTFEVTGYCACAECCGKTDGITASGVKATAGRTIAGPPSMPFGTEVYIEGLGHRVVDDRGGAIKEGKIDVYFDTHAEALAWGRKQVTVWSKP